MGRPKNLDIFNSPLSEDALPYLCDLLSVVSDGAQHVGIFRIPGEKARMGKLMEKARNGSIDEDDFRQLSGTNSDDVAVAASLLKMYFRELQTGVVCAPVLNSILVATDMNDSPAKLAVFKSLVSYLPRINILCLTLLCRVMRVIVEQEKVNLMTASNLASAGWAVTLFREGDDAMMNMGQSMCAMTYIIENSSALFEMELRQEALQGFTDRHIYHSIAEYDFDAEEASCELTIREGDTLFTKADGEGWCDATCVSKQSSRSGLVPANYLKHAMDFSPYAKHAALALEAVGRVSLTIHCGRNLPVSDSNGLSDPYVILLDEQGDKVGSTKVVKRNLNPEWEQTFRLVVKRCVPGSARSMVTLRVMDMDRLSRDDILGFVELEFDGQESLRADRKELPVMGADADSGLLVISYLYEPF